MTDSEKNIILGSLLGDANFSNSHKLTASISISHGGIHKNYALWRKSKLERIGVKLYERIRSDKRTKKEYAEIILNTRSHPYIHELYLKMKRKGVNSIINLDLDKELNPEVIAIWYCDDGNLYSKNGTNHLTIATCSFSEKELCLIINYFKKNYDILFKKTTNNSIRLTNRENISIFLNKIKNYIPESMRYKTW